MLKLYSSLAQWWPLLSPPEEYVEEAATYSACLLDAGGLAGPASTLVEFGSGGGNNAFHMKPLFSAVTLVDLSPEMLAVSAKLNPECAHLAGDMRTVRLGREYDRVFIHDAICYMTSVEDLRSAMETAFLHCRPGGAALFVPDFTRESFEAGTEHGGCDAADGRGLRYLGWTWDPDTTDTTYTVDYAYVLRDCDGSTHVEHDRNAEGLFARDQWLELLKAVGFQPSAVPFEHSEIEPGSMEMFLAVKPGR